MKHVADAPDLQLALTPLIDQTQEFPERAATGEGSPQIQFDAEFSDLQPAGTDRVDD
jgi:hypothetical protein